MTTTPTPTVPTIPTDGATAPAASPLGLVRGIAIVTKLELAQRIRSKKLYVALGIWFVIIGAVTLLMLQGFRSLADSLYGTTTFGPAAFGIITLFVLGLSLIVAPTFTAMSINGDRDAGTLAILQATRLSAVQIAGGKLVAAWLLAFGFLVAALPWVIVTTVAGAISPLQVVVCFLVMFVVVAIVCAIGLGWSALLGRPAASTVMTYASVALLTIILPIGMGFGAMLTTTQDKVTVWSFEENMGGSFPTDTWVEEIRAWEASGFAADKRPNWSACKSRQEVQERPHLERVWWLLAPNPFVIVADAAPLPPEARGNLTSWASQSGDPLAAMSLGVRSMAGGPGAQDDRCTFMLTATDMSGEQKIRMSPQMDGSVLVTDRDGRVLDTGSPVPARPINAQTPIWPWGLGFDLLLGGLMFFVAVRRLTVPYGVLPKGTRVA